MSTYAKILAALDQSPRSAAVFEHATTLAQTQAAQLMLIHCLTLPRPDRDFGDRYRATLEQFLSLAQAQMNDSLEEVRRWLSGYARDAANQGVTVDWDWRVGEAGVQICTAAQDWGADLIVVGRRGHSGLKEVLLGSVSNHVLHRAPCSVCIVQGTTP